MEDLHTSHGWESLKWLLILLAVALVTAFVGYFWLLPNM
jgi:hypothetical protein